MPRRESEITPETRIGDLLEAYPELERTFFELSPAFSKLKNPVLRKTVARVTTISQAARVGGIGLGSMIRRLRQAAGLEETETVEPEDTTMDTSAPDWLDRDAVQVRLDVRPLLERGEKPLPVVFSGLDQLEEGSLLELTISFPPAPLIDRAEAKGFDSWTEKLEEELFKVYFRRPGEHPADELVDLD